MCAMYYLLHTLYHLKLGGLCFKTFHTQALNITTKHANYYVRVYTLYVYIYIYVYQYIPFAATLNILMACPDRASSWSNLLLKCCKDFASTTT